MAARSEGEAARSPCERIKTLSDDGRRTAPVCVCGNNRCARASPVFNNITALREEHERILEQNQQILEGLRRVG
jgi:hypothetical protein